MDSSDHSRSNREKAEAASRYLEMRNYESYQKNGQRISTHRTLKADEGCNKPREVFIGKLPRDLFEDELLPKMEKAGRVVKMRLMMDFSGSNRGFAFAEYVTMEEAIQATKQLNETEIRQHEIIIVLLSFDNKKLSLGNLPSAIDEKTLHKQLDKVVNGVKSVSLKDCVPDKDIRFALVEFQTHDAATQARRILCPGNITICERVVSIDWAKPELPRAMPQSSPKRDQAPTSTSSSIINYAVARRQVNRPQTARSQPKQNHSSGNNHQRKMPSTSKIFSNFVGDRMPLDNILAPMKNCTNTLNNDHSNNGNINFPTIPAPVSRPLPTSTPGILGVKTRQMLAACPPDPLCTTIIENINLQILDESRLKAVLQLVNYLTITRMVPCAPATLEVTYENPYQARTVTKLLNQFPEAFEKLAVPSKQLRAYQVILPDVNANYLPGPLSDLTSFQPCEYLSTINGLLDGLSSLLVPTVESFHS